tara:strand:- start:89 stop:433 length:345 start_codon:yes stop_codon:yes gene_type:complete
MELYNIKRNLFSLAILAMITSFTVISPHSSAESYPLGSMTCDDIGNFAAKALTWRKRGFTPREAMEKLDELTFHDPVERQNLLDVLKMVYGGYGNNWDEDSAREAVRQDCMRGR